MPDSWYEMVLSLKKGVCPHDPDHDHIADLLDAMVAAVKRLQDDKQMAGYIAWLEIKVHQEALSKLPFVGDFFLNR